MDGSHKERLQVASKSWRAKIDSHESIHHDSLDSLGYDWGRVADPHVAPRLPSKVYTPRTTQDVVEAVDEARELGEPLRVRSQGHSSNDLVLTDGPVLLTRSMDKILKIDKQAKTARVQTGAINALVDDELARFDLGMPVIGDHKDITVGGFMAVGGVSPASHRFGLMIDNILALQVVDWDGRVHECSPDEDPDRFYANLAGLGQHGVMTEATLKLITVDKYRTIVRNEQTHYRTREEFIAGTQPKLVDPGDALYERGIWVDYAKSGKVCLGQFSAYHETPQTMKAKLRNKLSYDYLHGIGLIAGTLPKVPDKALKLAGMLGVLFSPGYASIKNVEFFTDKLLDSTVGDPTRMLIALAPLDRYETIFRGLWEVLEGARQEHDCFTFISVYVKSIRSPYLARDGVDRFCELMFFVGCKPERLTPEILDAVVSDFDDVVVANDAYRYMHSKTVKDAERRSRIDPNARHAQRREAQGGTP
jgi:hypothetical protein